MLIGSDVQKHQWRVNATDKGDLYYVNLATKASAWELPGVPSEERPHDVAGLPLTAAVQAFYKHYNSEKVGKVPHIVARYYNNEANLLPDLYRQYNEAMFPFEADLFLFYAEHCRAKIHNVPEIAQQWCQRKEELWSKLRAQYNIAEPTPPASEVETTEPTSSPKLPSPSPTPSLPPASLSGQPDVQEQCKARLTQFYRKTAPEKVEEVDNILQHYTGREAVLMSELGARHPEFRNVLLGVENDAGHASLTRSLEFAKERLKESREAVENADRVVKLTEHSNEELVTELEKSRAREKSLLDTLLEQTAATEEAKLSHIAEMERQRILCDAIDTKHAQRIAQLEDHVFRLQSDLMFARFADLPRGFLPQSEEVQRAVLHTSDHLSHQNPSKANIKQPSCDASSQTQDLINPTQIQPIVSHIATQTVQRQKEEREKGGVSVSAPFTEGSVLMFRRRESHCSIVSEANCFEEGEVEVEVEVVEEEEEVEAHGLRGQVWAEKSSKETAQLHLFTPDVRSRGTATEVANFLPDASLVWKELQNAAELREKIATELAEVSHLAQQAALDAVRTKRSLLAFSLPLTVVLAALAITVHSTPAPLLNISSLPWTDASVKVHFQEGRRRKSGEGNNHRLRMDSIQNDFRQAAHLGAIRRQS